MPPSAHDPVTNEASTAPKAPATAGRAEESGIFRAPALEHLVAARHSGRLVRFASLPLRLAVWFVVAAALIAIVAASLITVPVYERGRAAVGLASGSGGQRQPTLVAVFPGAAEGVRPGRTLEVTFESRATPLPVRVQRVVAGRPSPEELVKAFRLSGPALLALQVPGRVAVAPLRTPGGERTAASYVGSAALVNVEVERRRVIELLFSRGTR